jgi:cohesin complex subunit SCC1
MYLYFICPSILAGKRTPGLRLGSTPNKSSLLKRQKMTPKSGVNKRKLQLDDAMVLHAEYVLSKSLLFAFIYIYLYIE